MEKISLLGATGSIGQSTLDVAARYPEQFSIYAVAAGTNAAKLAKIAAETRAEYAVIADESKYGELKDALKAAGACAEPLCGADAIVQVASSDETDTVVGAIVGAAGIASTFAAAEKGKKLLLANKESVVCGGKLLMDTVRNNGAKLLPVDSEHNALFQCLQGASEKSRSLLRLVLTASGGPFRHRMDLSDVTVEEASHHPNWSMGRKITVDSSTLMNKGLEVIEARWLFDVPEERIDVVVHPQSIIHSMVQFEDGVVLAQMGAPDMRNTIAYSLGFPERLDAGVKPLNFAELGSLTFEAPDTNRFPQLAYAYEALKRGRSACIVLNAANEIAVEAFLERRIRYLDIAKVCLTMMNGFDVEAPKSLEEILAIDREARILSREYIEGLCGR